MAIVKNIFKDVWENTWVQMVCIFILYLIALDELIGISNAFVGACIAAFLMLLWVESDWKILLYIGLIITAAYKVFYY